MFQSDTTSSKNNNDDITCGIGIDFQALYEASQLYSAHGGQESTVVRLIKVPKTTTRVLVDKQKGTTNVIRIPGIRGVYQGKLR